MHSRIFFVMAIVGNDLSFNGSVHVKFEVGAKSAPGQIRASSKKFFPI
jgi:hypothetical protein